MSTVQTRVGTFVWHEQVSSEPAEAKEFYGQLFGWGTEVFGEGEFDYAMIAVGEQTHGGYAKAMEGAPPPHWLGHVLVESTDETVEKAKAAGGTLLAGPFDMEGAGRMAIVADPQGAFLGVYQRFSEGTGSEGVFVWDELMTSDVEDAKRFYGEVFGWTPHEFEGPADAPPYTLFRAGDADRAGCMAITPEAKAMGAAPHWIPYIGVEDVDAAAARATDLGATIYLEPRDIPTIGRIAVFGDPTGATVGLFRPAESS